MIYIFVVQFFPKQLNRLTKTLEMDYFSLTEKFDYIIYIWIIG